MNKQELLVTLTVLKLGRNEMTDNFKEHSPDIYAPSFKYENSPVLLKLAREKYFVSWLNSHWKIFDHITVDISMAKRKEIQGFFSQSFLELLSKSMSINSLDKYSNLGLVILKDMQTVLENFIKVGDNTEANINSMRVAQAKSVALFNRKIKEITEGK